MGFRQPSIMHGCVAEITLHLRAEYYLHSLKWQIYSKWLKSSIVISFNCNNWFVLRILINHKIRLECFHPECCTVPQAFTILAWWPHLWQHSVQTEFSAGEQWWQWWTLWLHKRPRGRRWSPARSQQNAVGLLLMGGGLSVIRKALWPKARGSNSHKVTTHTRETQAQRSGGHVE